MTTAQHELCDLKSYLSGHFIENLKRFECLGLLRGSAYERYIVHIKQKIQLELPLSTICSRRDYIICRHKYPQQKIRAAQNVTDSERSFSTRFLRTPHLTDPDHDPSILLQCLGCNATRYFDRYEPRYEPDGCTRLYIIVFRPLYSNIFSDDISTLMKLPFSSPAIYMRSFPAAL